MYAFFSRKRAEYCFESTVSEKGTHWVLRQTRWVLRKTRWVCFYTQIIGFSGLTEFAPRNSVSPEKLTEFGVWNRTLRNRIPPVSDFLQCDRGKTLHTIKGSPLPAHLPFLPRLGHYCVRVASSRAELKVTDLRWRSPICGFLRFSAKIFGFLREYAIFCSFLRPPNAWISKRRGESAKICGFLRKSAFWALFSHLRSVPLTSPWSSFPRHSSGRLGQHPPPLARACSSVTRTDSN